MAALTTPTRDPNFKAIDFSLPGVDGKTYTLADVTGENGLVVMFICNHCPYVQAVIDRIVRDMHDLQPFGIGSVAIMSNDVAAYPLDSLENMRKLSGQKGFTFPYLYDETQAVAKAYGAVCTPDFFGFNRSLKLCYRGRLDASEMRPVPDAPRELYEAMKEIARTGHFNGSQHPSMGCSVKWKTQERAA